MKFRSDFVTNSSSSSFIFELQILLKNGETLNYDVTGYEEDEYYEVNANISPKAMAKCKNVQELVDMLEEALDCEGNPILTENSSLIQDVHKIPSMDDIAEITITGTEEYDPELSYTQKYTYNCQTNTYTKSFDGEELSAINGASGGSLFVPDDEEANEISMEETADNTSKESDFLIKKGKLIRYLGNGKKVIIPEEVTIIKEGAFDETEEVLEVILPKGLQEIEERVFECCQFKSIRIPGGVKEILNSFEGCEQLEEIYIDEGVLSINGDAFADCESLRDVYLPASIEEIDDCAFYGCSEFTIHGLAGSYAEEFAEEQGLPFVEVSDI